ncbi:hypothetical protein [Cupriavidus sp. TMH.W2]|uniref:hypothetical protein n=1 Tax=Cupriavidus sp. TMH.W2 TaxID=3434465 RepID=UPI003D777A3E
MNTPNPAIALALDLLNRLVSRGLSLEDTARALGMAAKMVAVHHQTVNACDDAVDIAQGQLAEGYGARVVVGISDWSGLKAAYAEEPVEAVFANAQVARWPH